MNYKMYINVYFIVQVKISLKDWTMYYALEPHQYDTTSEDVWVLLESVRPESSQKFVDEEMIKQRDTHVCIM